MINRWVAGKTRDKITDILQPESVGTDSRLVLVNALYFKAPWLDSFNESATTDVDFFAPDGSRSAVPMMHSVRATRYFETADAQVVKLPYARGAFSMIVILPKDKSGLPALEARLDEELIEGLRSKLENKRVDLSLPKFKAEGAFDMVDALKGLGVKSAFEGNLADFSFMNGKRDLFINAASHKSFVEVNERGTEAAAATAIGVARMTAAAPQDAPVIFRADHPFIFLIQDEAGGTILFMGRVAKP
jgi:serpin B